MELQNRITTGDKESLLTWERPTQWTYVDLPNTWLGGSPNIWFVDSPKTGSGLNSHFKCFNRTDWADYFDYTCADFVGTGGLAWPAGIELLFEPAALSGFAVRLSVRQSKSREHRQQSLELKVRSVSDQVALVKAAFGLSISQLADVLRVKRPTVYAWFESEAGPESLRGANRERLARLCKLADEWNEQSKKSPQKYLSSNLAGDGSLLTMLSAAMLDLVKLQKELEAVTTVIAQESQMPQKESFGERLRKKNYAEVPSTRNRRR